MTTAAELIAQAKNQIQEISPQELHTRLGEVQIIDVREPGEFQGGHIPGAVNIPRGSLEFRVDKIPSVSDRKLAVVMQCQSGTRSTLAAMTMKTLGYQEVLNLAGGLSAWQAAGLPVEN